MENFQLTFDWANGNLFTIFLGFLSAIFVFLIGRWLARVLTRYASRTMERARLDPMIIRFMNPVIFVMLMVAVTIAALSEAGVHTTSLTALLASAGVAIGLALKDSLSNFAAGMMILFFKPYVLNNSVDVAGTSGSVEEVQVFNTILRTPDNVRVIVPNAAVINRNIRNYSAFESRRIDLVVSISYLDNIGVARDLLMDLMTSHPLVLANPGPSVEVLELAESSVNLAAYSWVSTEHYGSVRSDLLEKIKAILDRSGIRIPYPQQIVHLNRTE